MNLRRFALLIISAAVVIGAAAYAFRAPLSMAVAQRVAASRLAADTLNDLPDGLHVGLCGAGVSISRMCSNRVPMSSS